MMLIAPSPTTDYKHLEAPLTRTHIVTTYDDVDDISVGTPQEETPIRGKMDHITSHHITSHHIASHRITSHHIASRHCTAQLADQG